MADETLRIDIRLRNLAARNIAALDKGIVGVANRARGLGKVLTSVQGQLAGLGLAFAGGAFAASTIKVFTEFDDTMRSVGAVTGATREEMKLLSDVAKEMGATTKFSTAEAANGLRFLGMAGFDAAEAAGALPGVLKLAAAGGLELGQAADIATNILTGFNLEVDQLNSVNDVLVKTFTSANTNLVELGEAFKLVGPVAAGVGSDFEDLMAALGGLANAGLKGSIAGTALKGAIDALLNPTKEEEKLMAGLQKRMGGVALQVKDSEGNFIGFAQIIKQLQSAGVDGSEALRLFGLRAGPGMAALLGQGFDSIEDLTKALKEAGYTSDEIAEVMEGGIGGASRQLKAAFESLQITLGEAFEEDLIEAIRATRDWILDLTEKVKELKDNGTLSTWAKTAKQSFDVIFTIITKITQAIDYLTKMMATGFALITGKMETFKIGLEDTMRALDRLLGIDSKVEKEASTTFYKIDQETGKVIKTTELLASELKKVQDEYLETKKVGTDTYDLDYGAPSDRGAIGRPKKAASTPNIVNLGPSTEAKIKSDFQRLQAIIQKEMQGLDAAYDVGTVGIKQYFADREALVRESVDAEIAELERVAAAEENEDKRLAIYDKIFEKKQQLEADLLSLTAERISAEERLEKEKLAEQEKLNKQKLAVEQTFADIRERVAAGENAAGLQAQFQTELIELQNKQAQELEILRQGKVSENEMKEYYRLQDLEKKRLLEDQEKRLTLQRLDAAQQVAGGVADIFGSMYELTGKKQKEFFYAQKAAALAQATINIAEGITKAWGQGGLYGAIGAAAVAAAGAVQIAKIVGQGLAMGGEVKGYSPTPTSDNIVARLTAGEFVQPVSSVDYYGKGVMEAIRAKAIPRSMFHSMSIPSPSFPGRTHFASGGSVETGPAGKTPAVGEQERPININNFVDPALMSQHLQSSAGQKDVWNVLSQNQYKLKQLIFSQ